MSKFPYFLTQFSNLESSFLSKMHHTLLSHLPSVHALSANDSEVMIETVYIST